MTEPKQYEINTIVDLLELDDDQIDRICSEMPSMLKQVKALHGLLSAVGEAATGETPALESLSPMIWIDDGKTDVTIDVSCTDEDDVIIYKSSSA